MAHGNISPHEIMKVLPKSDSSIQCMFLILALMLIPTIARSQAAFAGQYIGQVQIEVQRHAHLGAELRRACLFHRSRGRNRSRTRKRSHRNSRFRRDDHLANSEPAQFHDRHHLGRNPLLKRIDDSQRPDNHHKRRCPESWCTVSSGRIFWETSHRSEPDQWI